MSVRSRAVRLKLFGGAALAVMSAAGGAFAQTNIEEIVVTARKRAEVLADVPISISAFSAESLKGNQITDLRRLADFTPGLSFDNLGSPLIANPTIRGLVQPGLIGDETNVANFIDGFYISGRSSIDASFGGLARIEVVRGPQSALYGRNAFSGAINYITASPGDKTEFGGSVTVGTKGRLGADGYIASPIVEDRLGVRLDYAHTESGGTYRDQNPASNNRRLNDTNTENVSGKIKMTPTDDLEVNVWGNYIKTKTSHQPQVDVATNIGRTTPTAAARYILGKVSAPSETLLSFDPRGFGERREIARGYIKLDYTVSDAWTLHSQTGYLDLKARSQQDLDPFGGTVFNFGGPPFTVQSFGGQPQDDRDYWTQELRADFDGEGFKGSFGGFFMEEESRQATTTATDIPAAIRPFLGAFNVYFPGPLADGSATRIFDDNYKLRAGSLFASATVDVTDQISITVEGRQEWEEKSAQNYANLVPGGVAGGFFSGTFKHFTPRFIVNYKPEEGTLLYASVAKGAKAGGFNPGAPVALIKYEEEYNWTYEAGTKLAVLDGRGSISGAGYYTRWINQQQRDNVSLGFGVPLTLVVNNARSRVYGAEFESSVALTDIITAGIGYSYIDAKFIDAVDNRARNLPDLVAYGVHSSATNLDGAVDGKRIPRQPKHSLNLALNANAPVSADWNAFGGITFNVKSKAYQDSPNLSYVGARANLDATLGIEDGTYKLSLWGQNLTNNKAVQTIFQSTYVTGDTGRRVQLREGRFLGVTVGAKY
ncbi:MAG: TonB-dependent receptor [Rhodospirillaceae bacterium]|nr:TonB-dependent receptor [Rhodospirillaceae bacterium]